MAQFIKRQGCPYETNWAYYLYNIFIMYKKAPRTLENVNETVY